MKQKFSVSLTLALVMAMLVTSLALADNVKNDVVVGGNDTITVGGSTIISYKIDQQPSTQDGQNGCNAADGTSAVISIITPAGVTATPSSLTFTNCTTWQSVSFTASGPGNYSISASVADANIIGGSYDTTRAAFTLVVNAAPPSDNSAPEISYVLNQASPDGNNGWYKSNVTLTWTVNEPDSPSSLALTGCIDQNITADQGATNYSCSASSDGGSAGPIIVTIKRDATNPDVLLVGGPANGGSYYFGSVPAAPTCSASDATSGLDGACSVSGYGTTVGNHTVTASASDYAGNTGTDSASYEVLSWTLSGFYQPVDMGSGIWNTVKGGSTVPFKFEVFAGSTEFTDTSVVQSFIAKATTCPSGAVTTDEIEFTTTGGTSLRYDFTAGQFINNWQTPKKPGACYVVTMTTQDGSSLSANFKLK